eukprot:gene20343-22346_t
MASLYQYSSSYSTPNTSVRRSSKSQTSYSSSGFPGSGYERNYSSTTSSHSTNYSSSTSNRSTDVTNNNGLVRNFAGSANDLFKVITDSDNAKGFKKQNFNKLKDQCRQSGQLFEDPVFPADDRSLFYSQRSPRKFVWKRPGELVSDPQMFVGGASRFDVSQGMLGDCWFLAAIGALTQEEQMMGKVVPENQSFTNDYQGIFRFKFWQYGEWREVVIDDRLPTYNNQLVFTHSKKDNEFWSALLEKAYAKLNGSYEALKGGQSGEALEDFTGGLSLAISLDKAPDNLAKLMMRASQFKSLMCAAIDAKSAAEIEAKLSNGLVKGHAYTISSTARVNIRNKSGAAPTQVDLIRVRNPWGNEKEWNGPWSDSSPEWKLLSNKDKKKMGLMFDHDGEFWITVEDFVANFTKLEICMLSPDNCGHVDGHQWQMLIHEGEWQPFVSAGGCRNYPDSFHTNPQFRITLHDPDENDDDERCQFVVGLMQKDRRQMKLLGQENLTIGFAIYKIDEDSKQYMTNGRLNKEFFLYNKMTDKSDSFVNSREIVGRFSLDPGEYVVVPSTFYPQEEGKFLLRMFSETKREMKKMDTSTKIEKVKPAQPATQGKWIEETLKKTFQTISGKDRLLDAFELRQAINQVFKEEYGSREEFGLEAASLIKKRSLIMGYYLLNNCQQKDNSGKVEFKEFRALYKTIVSWRDAFKQYDKDKSGDMDAYELRELLAKLGYTLGSDVLTAIVRRYSNKNGRVNFDDFVQACCRIKKVHDAYKMFAGKQFTEDNRDIPRKLAHFLQHYRCDNPTEK